MKRLAKGLLILILVAAAFVGGRWYGSRQNTAAGPTQHQGGRRILYYVDPMHPSYKSDKPGIAPDCGMRLEPVYADEGGAAKAETAKKVLYYRDPKAPDYRSDKPGLNPETGNGLEPVYEGDLSSMGPGTVKITAEKQQLIGVRYGVVEKAASTRTLRAVGKVTYDETRIGRVHTKIDGWIDQVFVDFTGKLVKKGQPLLTIYSPEMVATQQEYLLALQAKQRLKGSTVPEVSGYSNSLIEASRRRLELWDLSEGQIRELEETSKPTRAVTLESPLSGFVLTRNAFPKQRVVPDMALYEIADLSRVWIMADVFEYEAASVRLGQPATVSLSYYPGKTLHARVSYIQPQVDPTTRTMKIRLEVDNPGFVLKPDMFVDVEFSQTTPAVLTVPAEAVLVAGERKVVFVDRGSGFFEPRNVETGTAMGDRIEIRKGLREGERIVTSGNFLIDSESQLKSAMEDMGGHQHGGAPAAEHSHD